MIKKNAIYILILGVLLFASASAADKYMIDPAHSSVGFSVRHMVIAKVKGAFSDYSGSINFDKDDTTKSTVEVNIKTASINTNNERRDGHLKSEDFFYAEKYPEITFKSTKVEKTDDGFKLTGDLTMRGVTKEVIISFEYGGSVIGPMGKERLAFEGHTSLNRQDYGISWSKTLDNGGLIAGDEVKIELDIEAVKME